MMIKNFIVTILILMTLSIPAGAESNISIGNCCGHDVVPIVVSNANNVGSCDIKIRYDPSIVTVESVGNGDMDLTIANTEYVDDGWVRIVGCQINSNGLDGTFTIANVELSPLNDDNWCLLNISVETLKDCTPESNSLDYVVSGGKYDSRCDDTSGFTGMVAVFVVLAMAYCNKNG